MPGIASQEGGRHGAAVDEIGVPLAEGPAPRVEASRRIVDGTHADVGRQRGVERAADGRRLERAVGRERRDLSERMHAGVGPAGAHEARGVAQERTRGGEDDPLHGRHVALDLPARVRRAVVGELEAEDAR